MDSIATGDPIVISGHTLLPIEKSTIVHISDEQGSWCYGSKELVALVVKTASGTQVFGMATGPVVDSGRMSLDKLRESLPDIGACLE